MLTDTENPLLMPLIKIPEMIDWLSDVELNMAKEAKPHETVEGITAQIADLQVQILQKGCEMFLLIYITLSWKNQLGCYVATKFIQ